VLPYYKDGEIDQLLRSIKGSDLQSLRDRAIICFFVDTGVRCQELCDLNVGDVDREARSAEICRGQERQRSDGGVLGRSGERPQSLHAEARGMGRLFRPVLGVMLLRHTANRSRAHRRPPLAIG